MSPRRRHSSLAVDQLEDRRVLSSSLSPTAPFDLLVEASVTASFEDVRVEDVEVENSPVWGPQAITILQDIVERLPEWAERAENVIEQSDGDTPDAFNVSDLPNVSVIVKVDDEQHNDSNRNEQQNNRDDYDRSDSNNISVIINVSSNSRNNRNDDDDSKKAPAKPIKTNPNVVMGPLQRSSAAAASAGSVSVTEQAAASQAALLSAPDFGDRGEVRAESADELAQAKSIFELPTQLNLRDGGKSRTVLNTKLPAEGATPLQANQAEIAFAGTKGANAASSAGMASLERAVPIEATVVLFGNLQGADLQPAQVPLDAAGLDLGIAQLLAQLDDLGQDVAEALSSSGWLPYIIAAGCAGIAAEMLRRHYRRQQLAQEARQPALENSWSWTTGAY